MLHVNFCSLTVLKKYVNTKNEMSWLAHILKTKCYRSTSPTGLNVYRKQNELKNIDLDLACRVPWEPVGCLSIIQKT